MKHGKKINHLSRKKGHVRALMANMATSLILHKRISTTLPKAKALRTYIEPLITKSKTDDTTNRRTVFSYLQSKEAIKELFGTVSQKVATRNGGYTRILKTGFRLGDNAETCIIELVDFNEAMLKTNAAADTKKRTRRSKKGKAEAAADSAANESTNTSATEADNNTAEGAAGEQA